MNAALSRNQQNQSLPKGNRYLARLVKQPCWLCSHLIQMHQEGDVAAQVSCEFAVFPGQQESFRRSVGALLLSGRVHFFNSFSAVVQYHFTVPLEIKN